MQLDAVKRSCMTICPYCPGFQRSTMCAEPTHDGACGGFICSSCGRCNRARSSTLPVSRRPGEPLLVSVLRCLLSDRGWTISESLFWATVRKCRRLRPTTAPDCERDERDLCANLCKGACRWPGE